MNRTEEINFLTDIYNNLFKQAEVISTKIHTLQTKQMQESMDTLRFDIVKSLYKYPKSNIPDLKMYLLNEQFNKENFKKYTLVNDNILLDCLKKEIKFLFENQYICVSIIYLEMFKREVEHFTLSSTGTAWYDAQK